MFPSRLKKVAEDVPLPGFVGVRILLMPIVLGRPETVPLPPDFLPMLEVMAESCPQHVGQVVYLTIDQKVVPAGSTHRRSGLHVYEGTGLLTVSDVEGCVAWDQQFQGSPEPEGDCEHLRSECLPECSVKLRPHTLYWLSPGCVHESLPMTQETRRTFVRLSLPSNCDWYEGCTVNPLGIKPTGKIARQRKFLK